MLPIEVTERATASASDDADREARAIKRALLIVSPVARTGKRAAALAQPELASRGVDCEIAFTEAPQHATTLARAITAQSRFDVVLAVGGDGTVMEVITAFAGDASAPPVGIIPAGTANVLARTIGVPLSPRRAAAAALDSRVDTIDLGRTGDGRRFAIGLGVGLDAAMIAGASTALKRRLGYLAYVIAAGVAGLRLDKFHARLTVDGVVHEMETSSVLIANYGTVIGGRLCFGEDIRHDDGFLHACLYSPRGRLDAARILWRMLRGTVATDRCYAALSGRSIRIEAEPSRRAQADGELLGSTPIEIEVEAGAARLLVPRAPRARRAHVHVSTGPG